MWGKLISLFLFVSDTFEKASMLGYRICHIFQDPMLLALWKRLGRMFMTLKLVREFS